MKKVLVLFGGNSFEHDISCKSVINVIDSIDKNLYNYEIVGITKNNEWIKCNRENIINKDWYTLNKIDNIIEYLNNIDIVLPVLHGKNVEDGKLQGFFDLFNIKYVGCKTEASVIGMDKNLSKIFFNSIGIPQVPYMKYDNNIEEIETLGYPLIVKPANGGSSIGINKANNIQELQKAIDNALKYDNNIIVEKFIISRELECAVIEDNGIIISDIGEIKYNNDFYDFEDKYINEVELIIPSNIDNNIKDKIKEYSKKIFEYLGCSNLSRIDYLYDIENNKIYLNEINTLPGFTNISMYPLLLNNLGYSNSDIITTLLENAK